MGSPSKERRGGSDRLVDWKCLLLTLQYPINTNGSSIWCSVYRITSIEISFELRIVIAVFDQWSDSITFLIKCVAYIMWWNHLWINFWWNGIVSIEALVVSFRMRCDVDKWNYLMNDLVCVGNWNLSQHPTIQVFLLVVNEIQIRDIDIGILVERVNELRLAQIYYF